MRREVKCMKLKLPDMKLNLSRKISLIVGLITLVVTAAIGITSITYSSNMVLEAEEDSI